MFTSTGKLVLSLVLLGSEKVATALLLLKYPGRFVVATKVRYFGVKSTNVHRVQMGTLHA